MNYDIDIVIATLPKVDIGAPLIGVAQLKSMVEKHGFKCKLVDLNIDLLHRLDLEKYSHLWRESDITFRNATLFDEFKEDGFDEICEEWANQLLSHNARWIGFSFFSYLSLRAGVLLSKHIKNINPDAKIIYGGAGIFKRIKNRISTKLYDAYITGEGEYALVELLKGNLDYPGINANNFEQIKNLDELPFPDYSDAIFSLYPKEWKKEPSDINFDAGQSRFISITGSRGCVRNCTFCDVAAHWPKFRYRSGKNITDEMIHIHNNYNSRDFHFTDSLINGSIKTLNDLCVSIIDAKKAGKLAPEVNWSGQFICRNKEQQTAESYKLLVESGFASATIGIESGSESVRKHMKKHFSNDDIEFTFDHLAKHKIKIVILLIVGYPTETEKDFQDTLDFLTRYKKYNDIKMIQVNLGSPAYILENTPLEAMALSEFTGLNGEPFNFKDHRGSWTYKDNTYKIRIQRWIRLYHHAEFLGYTMNAKHLHGIKDEYKQYFNNTKDLEDLKKLESLKPGVMFGSEVKIDNYRLII